MSGAGGRISAEQAYAAATASRRHSLDELAGLLGTWLAGRLGVEEVVLTGLAYPTGAGTSSATVPATAAWVGAAGDPVQRELVFRLGPDRFQLFCDPDFSRQYRVLEALHGRHGVAVAAPLFYEEDTSLLGVPFYAMSRLQGWVPVSNPPYNAAGPLFEASPAQRRRAWTSAMEQLCAIARVPRRDVDFLDRPQFGADGLSQELEYWRRSTDWMTGGRTPDEIWALWEWVDVRRPGGREGLSWGDARIGNMMFGQDFDVVGVMDWEQACTGGPHLDLGWWLFFDDFFGEAIGLERLDGLGTRQETIYLWEELVGEPAGDARWYEVFTGLRVALLTIRTLTLMGAGEPGDVGANLALTMALRLADLPIPQRRPGRPQPAVARQSGAGSPAPLELEEVLSPAWLAGVLATRSGPVTVSGATVVEEQVTIASKIRFVAHTDRGEQALCVKGYLSPQGRAFATLGQLEARFYTELAPLLDLRRPGCVHAGIDPESGHGLVLMDDLVAQGCTFLTALSPYSVEQAAATLELLARLHSLQVDRPEVRAMTWLAPRLAGYLGAVTEERLGELLGDGRADGLDPALRDPARVRAALAKVARRAERRPESVVHGDAHAGNLYLGPDGAPGLVDWQVLQFGPWELDVAYHVAAVLEVPVRRSAERDLLAHYLEARRRLGSEVPGLEEAWDRYRAAAAYGYYMWAITQRVERPVVEAFVERLGSAVEDHESFERLGVSSP